MGSNPTGGTTRKRTRSASRAGLGATPGHLGDVATAELEIVQGVALAGRFGVGPAMLELLAARGFLELSTGRSHPEFELVIALPDATDRPITISSGTVRSMRLTREGVFQQRGRQPSMWLKV